MSPTDYEPQRVLGATYESRVPDVVGMMNRAHWLFYSGIGQAMANEYRYTGCSLRTEDRLDPPHMRFHAREVESLEALTRNIEYKLSQRLQEAGGTPVKIWIEAGRAIMLLCGSHPAGQILSRSALRRLGLAIEPGCTIMEITGYVEALGVHLNPEGAGDPE